MGCGAWKPCFLEVVSEGEDNMSNDEEISSPQDVTSHFQNILLIQGILIKQYFHLFFISQIFQLLGEYPPHQKPTTRCARI